MASEWTRALASFAAATTVETLPAWVVDRSKLCILDAIASAFASHQTGIGDRMRKTLPLIPGSPLKARIWVEGDVDAYQNAAIHNGMLVHAMIHDDMNQSSRGHMGNLIIPSTLAMAEAHGVSGKDVLAAVVAGYEVAGRIAEPAVAHSVARGFRGTATFGPFGVAAAAARLLGQDPTQMAHAISCAAGFAGGVLQPFDHGSMEWRLQNSMAIWGGILAATSASAGWQSSTTVIDGPGGFLGAFCGESNAPGIRAAWAARAGTLGKEFDIENTLFKPYSTCGYNLIACDIMLKLLDQTPILPAGVQQVEVSVSPDNHAYPGVAYQGPFSNVEEAMLSKPFTIAATLVFGDLQVETYTEGLSHPEIQRVAKATTVIADPALGPLDTEIRIATTDGRNLAGNQDLADLSQLSPDFTAMAQKLDRMAGSLVSSARQEQILEMVATLEARNDISALTGLLQRDR